ncbi:MAG: Fic family protein [Bacteroidetes bacterium]|nr:MAG: Fic family protein [Bacteroidota bacterium]
MKYNWQQSDWREFTFNYAALEEKVYAIAEQMGKLSGVLKALPEDARMEAIVDTMVSEAIKTSEIEGEHLNLDDVKSSIRNKLGLNSIPEKVGDKKSSGAGELMVAVRKTYSEPLSEEMLFHWHHLVLQESPTIHVGGWRTHEEPMQVVSGPLGKQRVHFEAPASKDVPSEMQKFIDWFNNSAPGMTNAMYKPAIRAALAHLYFESIHPFEDGNGRLGRAIAEKALSQGAGYPVFMSLSATIEANKKGYYTALEKAQKSNEVTSWLHYFLETIILAQKEAESQVDFILSKARFFDQHSSALNQRQLKAVKRMMAEGPKGFQGGMTARKYIALTKTSKATATRDLHHMVTLGALKSIGAGRSARYELVLT